MVDKISPLKMEHADLGGTETDAVPRSADPTEDGIVTKKVWIVSDETSPMTDTIQQGIEVDGSHNLVFYDRVSGSKTLAEIISGSASPTRSSPASNCGAA